MLRVKLSFLEDFRAIRTGAFERYTTEYPMLSDTIIEPTQADLMAKINGTILPPKVMVIDSLIRDFLKKGITKDAAFSLLSKEIEKLEVISEQIGEWLLDVPFMIPISSDIVIRDKADALSGLKGAEIKIGFEFPGINHYDDAITWKAISYALGLKEFTLFHIGYGDYRPYSFKLSKYTFYPNLNDIQYELVDECKAFIDWCKGQQLEKFITI